MNRLVRAELLKAASTRSTWVLSAAAAVFCVFWAVLQAVVFGAQPQTVLPVEERVRGVYQMAKQGYLFVLFLGILGMAGEYRHQTVTWSFLLTPLRGRVVAAKFVAYAILGFLVAVVCAVVTVAAAIPLLAATGAPLLAPGVPYALLASVLSTTLYAVLGVGLGALLRSQVAAVLVAFVWLFYAEFMLVLLLPEVGRWVPGGAANAVTGFQLRAESALLPAWAGGLLFLGYALAAAVAASLITVRRDVT